VTFLLKNSKSCHIQKRLGTPFVAYEFAGGRILNKYTVISPKASECLSLTRKSFRFAYNLKTIYSSKMAIEYS